MNVLLFVTCFLLILSMLTYAKIDSFRYFLGTQAQFEYYMNAIENAYGNKTARHWYDTTIANRQAQTAGANAPSKMKPAGPSSPRLGFRILVDTEMQRKNPQAYIQAEAWMKQLMHNLYGKYPFFQTALKKHPAFVDALLERIKRAVEELPPDKRPKDVSELANLSLGEEFEDVFYLMLKGCPTFDCANDSKHPSPLSQKNKAKEQFSQNLLLEETTEDEFDIAAAALECTSGEGYDSLLNYITLFNGTTVRVYLASKEVLEAVFGNSEIADNIIQNRYQLYQAVMRGTPPDEASIQFKALFQSYLKGSDSDLLDFRVSKTNPMRYN